MRRRLTVFLTASLLPLVALAEEAAAPAAAAAEQHGFFRTERWNSFALVLLFAAVLAFFIYRARSGAEMYVRRIPGIDALEEAIGRATEMGRPVLYVPGIEDLKDIQTLAGLLILGKVAEKVAKYNASIIVACRDPFVREAAEEIVKQGFMAAGRADAHKPDNIRFLSDEQFAFTAGTNGIMLREKPATNIYMGKFFAESLILAETGLQAGAIQVSGTTEVTQLPFFVVSTDYTLIGEELFAASAYLAKDDPRGAALLSTLKAADYTKIAILLATGLGVLLATVARFSPAMVSTLANYSKLFETK
jgi:hypothetical protein